MIDWFIKRLLDALQPRLEAIVRAAVDQAVESIAEEITKASSTIGDEILGVPEAVIHGVEEFVKALIPTLPKIQIPRFF